MAEEARRKDSLFGELMKTAGWVVMCQPGPNGGGHSEGMGERERKATNTKNFTKRQGAFRTEAKEGRRLRTGSRRTPESGELHQGLVIMNLRASGDQVVKQPHSNSVGCGKKDT